MAIVNMGIKIIFKARKETEWEIKEVGGIKYLRIWRILR